MILIGVALVLLAIAIAIIITIRINDIAFVEEHSYAIKQLCELNQRYYFLMIPNFNMRHEYDNEHFYDDISPQDYLVYALVGIKENVKKAISDATDNQVRYVQYMEEVNQIQDFNRYDTDCTDRRKKRLVALELQMYKKRIQSPTVSFELAVTLVLTKINGAYRSSKGAIFWANDLLSLIARIEQKKGNRYEDYQIWQSICRVERGKVTNRLRFEIYERDGNRCVMCGRSGNLEIDHIVPISKGGKSTLDNLQTLCHRCNTEKSNKVTFSSPQNHRQSHICPWCGEVLVIRRGQYGMFWGCSKYPKCRFTKQL